MGLGMTYGQEIIFLIGGSGALANDEGKFIFDTDMHRVVVDPAEDAVLIWENREIGNELRPLVDFPESFQSEIYNWVDAHHYELRTLMLPSFSEVTLDSIEDGGFVGETREIFGVNPETGMHDQLLGRVGVVQEQTPEGKVLNKLLFVSVDGTWATISVWYAGDEPGKNLTQLDATFVSVGIAEYAKTILP